MRQNSIADTEDAKAAAIRILVVDDDVYARETMMAGLERRGYDVAGAEDGLEALDHLQREHFDLVVTDIQMPRMDGVALLREIRRKGYAPVVVQTTLVDYYLRDILCRAGASGVLVKGDPVPDLTCLVEKICRKPQESSAQLG